MSLTRQVDESGYFYINEETHDMEGVSAYWYSPQLKGGARGGLMEHCVLKDDQYHGEYIRYSRDGALIEHKFYMMREDITHKVLPLVEDIENLTDKEKFLIKMTFGIDCVPPIEEW